METTGLNPDLDEIIEIGMVPFTYGAEGQIHSVEEPFSILREPSTPISAEVTKITNITNEMVEGKTIDPDQVFDFAKEAGLIIAHNASFDRQFMEKFAPDFSDKPWACSMSQVPWKEEGFDGRRLSHIAAGFGFFYDAHRAVFGQGLKTRMGLAFNEHCWILDRRVFLRGAGRAKCKVSG